MEEELGRPADQRLVEEFSTNPELNIIEFAHTPHLGHIGFFRMLVVAADIAMSRSNRVLMLVFNDHVLVNALSTIRCIPVTRDGKEIERPPAFGIPKADRERPLHFVPPPTKQTLNAARESLQSVMLFERSRCGSRLSKASISRNLDDTFSLLAENAGAVKTISAWFIRTLLDLLRAGTHREIPLLVLTGSHLTEIMPEYFAAGVARRAEIIRCQNDAAKMCDVPWPEWSRPKLISETYFPAWFLCDQCREVTDRVQVSGNEIEIYCRTHRTLHDATSSVCDLKFAPKVVLRQPLANLLGIEMRVCGNPLGYWNVADQLSSSLFSCPPPRRVAVTGSVRFTGMTGLMSAAPPIIRVLSEMSVGELVPQLSGDCDADVVVDAGCGRACQE